MIYKFSDQTSQGIVYRSTQSYLNWDSEWEYKGGVLTCIRFTENVHDNVLKILTDPLKEKSKNKIVAYMYRRCVMAWNRHKAEIEKQIGIYKPKKKKEIKTQKVLYIEFREICQGEMKEGAKSIGYSKNPTKTPWTEKKQKMADEYNRKDKEHRMNQTKLFNKIFEEKL